MTLSEQIDQDLIAAIKSGDESRRDILRYLKSSLKNHQINEQKVELTDDDALTVIAREVKKRKESIAAYEQIGKTELAQDEQKEIDILQKYLPAQMDESEVTNIVNNYMDEHKDGNLQIGQVIGALSPQLKGKADMSLVAKLIKERLG
jgi:uncharacterized protein YqeY